MKTGNCCCARPARLPARQPEQRASIVPIHKSRCIIYFRPVFWGERQEYFSIIALSPGEGRLCCFGMGHLHGCSALNNGRRSEALEGFFEVGVGGEEGEKTG
jgi:hypothetical protein